MNVLKEDELCLITAADGEHQSRTISQCQTLITVASGMILYVTFSFLKFLTTTVK